jgi:hypothetical protein
MITLGTQLGGSGKALAAHRVPGPTPRRP